MNDPLEKYIKGKPESDWQSIELSEHMTKITKELLEVSDEGLYLYARKLIDMLEDKEDIVSIYYGGIKNRFLKIEEYPDENICSKCVSCGGFTNNEGEKKECEQDKQAGDCFTRYTDYESIGQELEQYLIKNKLIS